MSLRLVGESRSRVERQSRAHSRAVLIAGAGHAGMMVVREMARNPSLAMVPVGFLDDDPAKLRKQIFGVPVLGSLASLADVVRERPIDEVIIAMPAAPGHVLRGISDKCRQLAVASRTMPGVFELLDGNVSVNRLRDIEIADLLRRAQVEPARDPASYIAGRTVMVTGGGGSIGLELCRQLAHARPGALVLLGHGENSVFEAQTELRERFPALNVVTVIADIRDQRRLRRIFQRLRPSIVFHAAAHKHVPLMEENPEEAITNNVLGTHEVLEAAIACGTDRFVLISTDKAVAPCSLMGASKRMAEMLVRNAARRTSRPFVVVRFGNVLGSRGSVVPRFKQQIASGGPVTVTHPEMKRFFMTIPEAVHLVLEAGGMGRSGELFVLKMGDPIRIVDLARDVVKLSGATHDDIPIVFTGIRPGEKLEEQLWEDTALAQDTRHPDILSIIEPDLPADEDIQSMLRDVERAVADGDVLAVQAVLARAIPTYAPYVRGALASS
jgi:FlaA1/EpsC-like NDP-sugar epimerase